MSRRIVANTGGQVKRIILIESMQQTLRAPGATEGVSTAAQVPSYLKSMLKRRRFVCVYKILVQNSGVPRGPSGEGDATLVFQNLTGGITYHNPNTPTPGSPGNVYFTGNFTSPPRNASGFIVTGSYGSGRNIGRGPGWTNLDMALAKSTKITERTALQLRFEVFNIFNHPEFLEPDTNISSSTFGQVTSTYGPRIIQLAARITF